MQTVLIAEDHADTRYVLERMLRHAGYDVVAVPTGAEALRLIALRLPAVAVLDCDMPGVGGHDVLRAVRADPRTRGLPVVMFTADDSPACRAEAERLGVDAFLVKGASPWDGVVAAVRRLAGDPAP